MAVLLTDLRSGSDSVMVERLAAVASVWWFQADRRWQGKGTASTVELAAQMITTIAARCRAAAATAVWHTGSVARYGRIDTVSITVLDCLCYGVSGPQRCGWSSCVTDRPGRCWL